MLPLGGMSFKLFAFDHGLRYVAFFFKAVIVMNSKYYKMFQI